MRADVSTMTGLRKAAIVLRRIGGTLSGEVLSHLRENDVAALIVEIDQLGDLSHDDQESVVDEFCRQSLLESSCTPRASSESERVRKTKDAPAFECLHNVAAERVASILSAEHPQTAAVILSHLPPDLAAETLPHLPQTSRLDVVRRIAMLGPISADVVRDIEQSLENRLSQPDGAPPAPAGGVTVVARMMNVCDPRTNQSILSHLAHEHAELAGQIRRILFPFDDLLKLDDASTSALLEEVSPGTWVLALKGASVDLKQRVLQSLPRRSSVAVSEELEELGPVRISDVESAQQEILNTVGRLQESGRIAVGRISYPSV